LLEAAAAATLTPPRGPAASLAYTGALRLAQGGLVLGYWRARGWHLGDLGRAGPRVGRGWAVGLGVAAAFGVAVGTAEAAGRLGWGVSPLAALAGPPPPAALLPWLLPVGGVVAPAVEELVFRGLVYGGLRQRLGPVAAAALCTAVFALAHVAAAPVPWVQAVGGLAFCAAYEASRSLWAPYLVHSAGNLALFLAPYLVG
ncbi:MAG: CPBP family intramembrane glutamic endopeptidase, partial [Deferrisomatales bacterium]